MAAKAAALAAACLLALAAPASAQPAPAWRDIEPADRALTRRAYDSFRRHCPGLAKLAPLIEQITVNDMAFILNEDAKSKGWTIAVSVEIKFRENATHLAYDLGIVLLNDYRFMLGAGTDPGILSMASDGLRLCAPHYPSNFIAAPDLRFLTRWPSEAADQRRKLDSAAYPLSGTP